MSDLDRHVEDYLRMRRALGFKLTREGQVLHQLVAYVDAAGATALSADLAIAWARLPQGVQPMTWANRLRSARGFAIYLKTIEPSTEVPARDVFPARTRRATPYLWPQSEVCRLLEATRRIRTPLRAATYEALFGLLAVSGMRLGEAIALERDDVDLTDGVLTLRDAKLGRSRLVPVHSTVTEALRSYNGHRDRLCSKPASKTFFVSSAGTALLAGDVEVTFNQITTALGLRTETVRPRIHDLRHSFAVRTLIDWHGSRAGVEGRMVVLSTYLGHVAPSGTYWYLSASPELVELAAARLDGRYGGQP